MISFMSVFQQSARKDQDKAKTQTLRRRSYKFNIVSVCEHERQLFVTHNPVREKWLNFGQQ